MSVTLYVGGVSYSSTEDSLRDAFSAAGAVVSAKIIMDKMTGRSRGFGFVEMENDADAEKAIAMLNEKELDGRKITVNIAKPLGDRPPRREGNGNDDRRPRQW
jgi:RNA recognition motif-containing protein